MDTIAVYDAPENISWTKEYKDVDEKKPLKVLFTQSSLTNEGYDINLETEIGNLRIYQIVKEDGVDTTKPLTYFTDYTYDVAVDPGSGEVTKTVRLYKEITKPTKFNFVIIKP
jgi:hypothetical protein